MSKYCSFSNKAFLSIIYGSIGRKYSPTKNLRNSLGGKIVHNKANYSWLYGMNRGAISGFDTIYCSTGPLWCCGRRPCVISRVRFRTGSWLREKIQWSHSRTWIWPRVTLCLLIYYIAFFSWCTVTYDTKIYVGNS